MRVLLLLGMVALLAGVWAMIASVGTDAVPVGFDEAEATANLESGLGLTGHEIAEEEATTVTETGFERSEIEATEATAATKLELLRIRVTRRDTGEPVPGAEVAYAGNVDIDYQELSPEEQKEYMRLARDQELYTRHYGKTVLADSEGVAFISAAQDERYLQVTGRHEQLYGQLTVRPDTLDEEADREFKLELERDVALTVQVLDSLGRPAVDVPVGIVPADGMGSIFYNPEMATSEAPRGLARVRHLQVTVRQWEKQGDDFSDAVVKANIPGLTEGSEPFDPRNPPEDPIVLRLPPIGRVVVETTDAEGERLPLELGSINLAIAPEDPLVNLARYNPPPGQQWFLPPEKDGSTIFKRVVAGREYLATAYLSMESVKKIFSGPMGEDHEVRVTLSPTTRAYLLVGRAVDEERGPTRNTRLRAVFETDGGSNGSRSFRTDDDGRFNVTVGMEGRPVTLNGLSILYESSGPRPDNSTSMYVMRGIRQLDLGKNDLGDVVLGPSPLVAAGFVLVDGEVSDREQFDLQVERLQVRQTSTRTTELWRQDRSLALRFLEKGRFEIRGVSRPARYRIGMGRNMQRGRGSFLPLDPIEFAPGWDDVRIHLETGSSVQAVVLADGVLTAQSLLLRMAASDGTVPEEEEDPFLRLMPFGNRLHGVYNGEQEGRHTFRWGALQAGVYRLEVLTRGARKPVVTVEGIQIEKGEPNKDPRLDGIDLRGKLRRIEVTVQDMNGKRIPDSNYGPPFVLINDPLSEEAYGFSARNGKARVVTAEPSVDLMVAAQGYVRKELYGVREDTTVVLEPWPEIVIKIANGLPELPEGTTLNISLTRQRRQRDTRPFISDFIIGGTVDSWLRAPVSNRGVNERGEIALQVEGDGTYSVRVSLRSTSPRRSSTIRDIEPPEIEVRNLVGRPVFQIQIPEESLKQALEQLGGR